MTRKPSMTETATFWLGVVGSRVAARFADEVAALGLKPKHVALLAILDQGRVAAQQDLASELRVVPSLVVSLTDHLEEVGAVTRERDLADRRRQTVAITPDGRRLLAECAALGATLDDALTAGLDARQRRALLDLLMAVGANDNGLG